MCSGEREKNGIGFLHPRLGALFGANHESTLNGSLKQFQVLDAVPLVFNAENSVADSPDQNNLKTEK